MSAASTFAESIRAKAIRLASKKDTQPIKGLGARHCYFVILRVTLAETGWSYLSVALTSNLNVPFFDGVPLNLPLESSTMPGGSFPLAENLCGPAPPETENCSAYLVPTVPSASFVGDNAMVGEETFIVNCFVSENPLSSLTEICIG